MNELLFWVLGYCLLSILIETPVLLVGLSARHSLHRRIFAGVWLTACTYPIVGIALPALIHPVENRAVYLAVAETFAPVAECALFWLAFGARQEWGRPSMWRDFAAIVTANLASFLIVEALNWWVVLPYSTPPTASASSGSRQLVLPPFRRSFSVRTPLCREFGHPCPNPCACRPSQDERRGHT